MNKEEMQAQAISNNLLFELIRDFKEDQRAFNESLKEDMDRKFERMEEQIRDLKKAVDRNSEKIEKNSERIEELFFKRDNVKITFSRTFAFANMFISALVAYFVVLFGFNEN